MKLNSVVENVVIKLLKLAATRLPKDIEEALINAKENEKSEVGRVNLKLF